MFCFLFGWRKTSKCKSVVKQLQCRLKLFKNKKYAISSHYRHDIAQLLRIGERDRAFHRAQQLFLDENLMSLYHLLLHFSDIILLNLSYIRRRRDLPDGINEAVSTLVFASARCGDLPELRTLRIIFGERYGQHFVDTALSLLPGNCVNPQVIEKLSIITVSYDAKSKLLREIAEEQGLRLEVLALQYTPEFHKQVIKEEKEVMGSALSSARQCASQEANSKIEVYKLTLIDADIEEKQEQQSRSKASSDQRKVCDEDDCIEEEVMEKDQSVFRFKETKEERKERKRSRRKKPTSSSSSSPVGKDLECWRYYYKGKRSHQKKDYGKCYHIVYNVFTMLPDQKGNVEGERSLKEAKHVHPKLPDYDQIVAHFTALRKQHKHMRSP